MVYYLLCLGSPAAFQRVYESPICVARQPGASDEDKEMGTHRAEEVSQSNFISQ